MLARGRVTQLHRWPVKSMAGQPVDALRLDERGAAGDRAHALFDEFKGAPRRLTVRQVPRMLLWHAGYDGADVSPDDVPFPELLRWLTRERRMLFGMNARPLHAATIAVGDPVSVR